MLKARVSEERDGTRVRSEEEPTTGVALYWQGVVRKEWLGAASAQVVLSVKLSLLLALLLVVIGHSDIRLYPADGSDTYAAIYHTRRQSCYNMHLFFACIHITAAILMQLPKERHCSVVNHV